MFWNFVENPESSEDIELRIEGDIVSDDDAWFYEWLGLPVATPNAFRTALGEHKGKNITVWIDSYGGDVFAAAGIYNALKEHKGKVTVKIDGKAMSAASVIAMAGDEIKMSPVSILMIHNPWSSVRGEAKDMRHAADVLDEVKETIINAYQAKTKRSRSKISEMMDEETFMSAKKALKEGFVDEILYTDSGSNTETDNALNFSRVSIMNSVSDSMARFFEVFKKVSNKLPSKEPKAPIEEPRQAPVDLYNKLNRIHERRLSL